MRGLFDAAHVVIAAIQIRPVALIHYLNRSVLEWETLILILMHLLKGQQQSLACKKKLLNTTENELFIHRAATISFKIYNHDRVEIPYLI